MIDRRTLLGSAACLAAGMGLSGCGRVDDGPTKGAELVPTSWAAVRISEPSAIDPLSASDRAGMQVLRALYSPLTRVVDGGAVPYAARGFEVSEDALSVSFKLLDGAVFHNGEAVTASSFKRAWERLVRPIEAAVDGSVTSDDAAPRHGRWCALLSSIEGYEALYEGRASELVGLRCPDDLTLEVSFTRPSASFPTFASHPALGPVPSSADVDPEGYASKPVGNGPFKLKRAWSQGDADIRLARFDGCSTTPALAEGLLFSIQGDVASAYNQFLAGNLDICDVPVDQLRDAEKAAGPSTDPAAMKPGERLAHGAESGLTYLVCNTRAVPFSLPEFRRAVSLAIDREALCRKALAFSAEPAQGPVSTCAGGASPWEACFYDAERAAEVVESLRERAEDGEEPSTELGSAEAPAAVQAEPLEPLVLDFTLLYRKGGTQARMAAQIAADLHLLGVNVKTSALDAEDLLERYGSGGFTCGLATLNPAVATAEAVADALFGPDSPRAGWTGWEDADLSATLEGAATLTDAPARAARVEEALALAGAGLPVIPLVHPAYTKIADDRVSTAKVCPDGTVDPQSIELA